MGSRFLSVFPFVPGTVSIGPPCQWVLGSTDITGVHVGLKVGKSVIFLGVAVEAGKELALNDTGSEALALTKHTNRTELEHPGVDSSWIDC